MNKSLVIQFSLQCKLIFALDPSSEYQFPFEQSKPNIVS